MYSMVKEVAMVYYTLLARILPAADKSIFSANDTKNLSKMKYASIKKARKKRKAKKK